LTACVVVLSNRGVKIFELMMKMQPHQLLFFGHLLNLPEAGFCLVNRRSVNRVASYSLCRNTLPLEAGLLLLPGAAPGLEEVGNTLRADGVVRVQQQQ
jgi:hypothetical protein